MGNLQDLIAGNGVPPHLAELVKNDGMRRTSKVLYTAGYKESSFQKDFHKLQGDKKSGLRRAKLTALRIVLLDSSAGGMVPAHTEERSDG